MKVVGVNRKQTSGCGVNSRCVCLSHGHVRNKLQCGTNSVTCQCVSGVGFEVLALAARRQSDGRNLKWRLGVDNQSHNV